MEVFDWIADHWMHITSGGFILLAVAWLISVTFKTVWGEWKRTANTKRREQNKLGDKQCCNKHQPRL